MGLNVNEFPAQAGNITRNYLFIVYLESYPAGYSGDTTFQTNVDFYTMKAIFPERKTQDIELKWAGQSMHFSGVDESPKNATLTFNDDEDGVVYKTFSAMQELSGSESSHAAATSQNQNFNMGFAQISTDKKTIVKYRRIKDAKVLGVKLTEPDKEGNALGKVDVSIVWNISETDSTKAGTSLE